MKKAITVRIDPELLASARKGVKQENRTLTNFIETALKERIGSPGTSQSKQGKASSSGGL